MFLNILLDYDKLFFKIFKKSISMNNNIIDSFCKSDEGKLYIKIKTR